MIRSIFLHSLLFFKIELPIEYLWLSSWLLEKINYMRSRKRKTIRSFNLKCSLANQTVESNIDHVDGGLLRYFDGGLLRCYYLKTHRVHMLTKLFQLICLFWVLSSCQCDMTPSCTPFSIFNWARYHVVIVTSRCHSISDFTLS